MALGTYNTDGTKQTQKEYYAGNQKGNYQFIPITDIINNFIVSQVGDDKIIKSAGLSGNKKSLPWIVNAMYDWNGEDNTKEFLSNLPCPIRLLYNFY